MLRGKRFIVPFLVSFIFISCNKDDTPERKGNSPNSEITAEEPVEGGRLSWDFNSLKRIAGDNSTYNGYPRLIQLNDDSLLMVYESDGKTVVKKSTNSGDTWSSEVTVADSKDGVNMATPDIIQLEDGSIIVGYNPRPTENANDSEKFAIRTVKSYDNGDTWEDDTLVYEASNEFDNGCWEPSLIQLPDGEIQLFFSNENIYRDSNEQNITLMRSENEGISWSESPEIVSFREGSRDGMPKPILLNNESEIVVSIEDNGENNQFKPYIIQNSINENWNEIVTGSSNNRNYALKDELSPSVYAGAPYLGILKSGDVLLSYQGTENRETNNINNAEMRVVMGNSEARNFNRVSTPFRIPEGKSSLWNSFSVLDDNSIRAVTTTNAFSQNNTSEVWMITGYFIPEIEAQQKKIDIDGVKNEDIWKDDFPIFIGGKGTTQLSANLSYDSENLYVLTEVKDNEISLGSDKPGENDGISIYLDPSNKSLVSPHSGIYKIILSADNIVSVYEGEDSNWSEISSNKILNKTENNNLGYYQEIAIPWSLVGGIPAFNTRIGFNIELMEKGSDSYFESIPSNKVDEPYTWSTLNLRGEN